MPYSTYDALHHQGINLGQQWGIAAGSANQDAATLDANADQDRNSFMSLLSGGQQAFETSARSAMEAAMPALRSQLQGVQESSIRRGVENGGLGTSYEGDVMSAFQKHMTDSIASQALGLYGQRLGAAGGLYNEDVGRSQARQNQYLDLLGGNTEYELGLRGIKAQKQGQLLGAIGQVAGAGLGALAAGA